MKEDLVQTTSTGDGGRIPEAQMVKLQQIQEGEGDRPSLVGMGVQEEGKGAHQEGNRVVAEVAEELRRESYQGEP